MNMASADRRGSDFKRGGEGKAEEAAALTEEPK
jgi:hypothetical protein